MKPFKHPNFYGGFTCPVCNTSADRPVVLLAIPGTERDGNCEAVQVHHECAKLVEKMAKIEEKEKEAGK